VNGPTEQLQPEDLAAGVRTWLELIDRGRLEATRPRDRRFVAFLRGQAVALEVAGYDALPEPRI
jgi:hypothetical protein